MIDEIPFTLFSEYPLYVDYMRPQNPRFVNFYALCLYCDSDPIFAEDKVFNKKPHKYARYHSLDLRANQEPQPVYNLFK